MSLNSGKGFAMNLTIDKKVGLLISLPIFALGAILGLYFMKTQTVALNNDLDTRGRHLLVDLVTDLEYPLLTGNQEGISRTVKIVMAEEDVVFCRIEGKDGAVIYQEGTRERGPVREFASTIVTGKSGGAAESLILDVPQEKTEAIGTVSLVLSLTRLNQRIWDINMTVAAIVCISFVFASLGAYLLLKRLIGVPVEQLVRATKRIAAGDLAYQIPHTMKDEFEILGQSFNRMTESLREAQEELLHREKLAMLGQLAGGMGNELRNPLGVMNNAVFFLKDTLTGADETVREYLEIITSEIRNSNHIITDFIDFFHTHPPRPKSIQISVLMSECLKKCAVPDNVAVTTDLPESLPPLKVDPVQAMQVFQNLIVNAVQAMPNGGALLVAARLEGSGLVPDQAGYPQGVPLQDLLAISVTDTGEGISPENMDKIFQPLFSTKSRGIGLGLPITKNLVEINGGRIEVASELGIGTTFKLLLPLERSKI